MSGDVINLEDFREYWRECAGSPEESYDFAGGPSVVRRFHGPWETRHDFARTFMENPFYEEVPGVRVTRIQITPRSGASPERQAIDDFTAQHNEYPGFPTRGGAECTVEYGIEGAGSMGSGSGRDSETSEPGSGNNGFLTYKATGAAEAKGIPGRRFRWASDDVQCPDDMLIIERELVTGHSISWSRMRGPNWALFENLTGTINSTPFRMPVTNVMYEPGTVLFETYDSGITYDFSDLDNPWLWEINFSLSVKKNISIEKVGNVFKREIVGWNWVRRYDKDGVTTKFDRPCYKYGKGKNDFRYMYEETNLNLLFG